MAPSAANLHDLNYRNEARLMGPPPTPITDIHLHLRGRRAVTIFKEAADCYGIDKVVTMTPFDQMENVTAVMGDRVRFIAIPDWRSDDPAHAHGPGFTQRIRQFAQVGAPLCKFWAAPRARDFARQMGDARLLDLDGPIRREQIELAASLGMGIMTHIGDPDTWFQTTYADADLWGTKAQQYDQLEAMLEAVPVPWLAAHMGGWPEDLDRLDSLLERYDHLHLDTSATKWMVRELSRCDTPRLEAFLRRWSGRICFGSDIVTQDEHLQRDDESPMSAKASSPNEAFDLYASRYWALRTLWERDWSGPSPIADPDLHMVDAQVDPMASPLLSGHALDSSLLTSLYQRSACELLTQLCCAT
ncbi:MAG: hypothetical protein MK101_10055 [Phycisphaerales bacterium]|nr:hypothetical protein [Phycisphaerales bacterium]